MYPLFLLSKDMDLEKKLVIEKIEESVERVLQYLGLDLVDIAYKVGGKKKLLRVLADRREKNKGNGVTLAECAEASRKIGEMLDEEDLPEDSYLLEVSSPGLDRPLKTVRDFRWAREEDIEVKMRIPFGDKERFVGTVVDVDESKVSFRVDEETITVSIEDIEKAKIKY